MRTKLFILLFTVLLSGFIFSTQAIAQTGDPAPTESPADSYLTQEKRSIATSETVSGTSMSVMSVQSASSSFFPGDPIGGGTEIGNIVNGPIGDITLPMVVLLLVIYFVYRGVTTSRRRNNL